jgi:hypothetical protein
MNAGQKDEAESLAADILTHIGLKNVSYAFVDQEGSLSVRPTWVSEQKLSLLPCKKSWSKWTTSMFVDQVRLVGNELVSSHEQWKDLLVLEEITLQD